MIEQGLLSKADFLQKIQRYENVLVRFGVTKTDEASTLAFFYCDCGIDIDRLEPRTWKYRDLTLFERHFQGSTIRHFLEERSIEIDRENFLVPEIADTLNWTRRPSQSDWGFGKFAWPTVENILLRSANVSFSNGFLIGGDPPSFQSHSAGIAAFLGIDLAPGQQFNPSDIAVRFHDTSGRITKVIWSTTSIDVVIEGDALDESIIELASQKPGEKRNLASERCQKFSFNIPDTGLPPGSWLQLHRGGNLLDYKFLNWPYSLVPDSGVERVVEKNNEIQSLISQGEGPTVEFKEDVPTTNNAREKAIKTIAAFANGQGGKILFGVRDDGTVKGVPPEQQTRSTIDAMTNSIWDLAIPTPEFEVDVVPINVNEQGRAGEPKAVMVVTVHKGSAPPYGIKPNKPEFYVRRGSSTYHAPPDQIRSMVAQSLQTTRDFSAQGFLRY